MSFLEILQVRATHSFYTDKRCPDVALVPTAKTEAMLRNHRCQLRATPGRVSVKAAVDAAGAALLPLPAGAALRFTLEPTNRDFSLFTDLSTIRAKVAPLYTNAAMAAGAEGVLALVAGSGGDGKPGPRVLAEIEIVMPGVAPGSNATMKAFEVPLEAKQTHWAYYCITDLDNALTAFHIVDTAPPGVAPAPPEEGVALVFRDADRRIVTADDPSDSLGAHLARRNPTKTCVRFISSAPVPHCERPRRYLELRLDDHALSKPLANPAPERSSSIEWPLSGGAPPKCEVLAHIIEYHRNTTPASP